MQLSTHRVLLQIHNKGEKLGSLKTYWQKMGAGILSPFKSQAPAGAKPEQLRREILSVSREHHTLTSELERLRADLQRAASDATGRVEALAPEVRESVSRTSTAENKLAVLEQRFGGLESAHTAIQDRVETLGNSLSEFSTKQETRNSQLKFLQDSARGEIKALKTAQAEIASRLETRDNQLEALLESTQAAVGALENTLVETAARLDTIDDRFQYLQDRIGDETQQRTAALSGIATRLDTTGNRLGALEEKLEIEHRLYQSQFEEMQMNFSKLERRFVWMLLATTLVLLLIAVRVFF